MHFHTKENFELVLDIQEILQFQFPVPASVSTSHSNCSAVQNSLRCNCRKYTSPRGQIISVAFSGHFRALP